MQPASPVDALARLRTDLSEFVSRLRQAIDDNLVSVVLFGGAARGVFNPETSDVNLMIVLQKVDVGVLDQVGKAAEPLRHAFQLNLLTVTEGDLGDSAEVFPTKFLDIQRHHQTLWGKDVTSTLAIPKDRLQRQALRQLMNLHLRLRQAYLDGRGRPEQLDGMIRRSVTTLTLNLGVLLELRTGQSCETMDALLDAAERAGLERSRLTAFLDFKQGRQQSSPEGMVALYDSFMKSVEAALRLGELQQG